MYGSSVCLKLVHFDCHFLFISIQIERVYVRCLQGTCTIIKLDTNMNYLSDLLFYLSEFGDLVRALSSSFVAGSSSFEIVQAGVEDLTMITPAEY